MKIAYIGKFNHLHDEEYIAQAFEYLGHTIIRIPISAGVQDMRVTLETHAPDIILFAKWNWPVDLEKTITELRRNGTKLVCWMFDLYFGYEREWQVKNFKMFKADYVFSTDGGHADKWKEYGVNHYCVRQGIIPSECYIAKTDREPKYEVVFVGSNNPLFPERKRINDEIAKEFKFKWFGSFNSNEIRGIALNELYANTKIVIGDSFYSPNYWSNRVVETLGRGGFLIHQEVDGLKEEYPHIVTYKRGDIEDLKAKIRYYIEHDAERRALIQKNLNWVKENYTVTKKVEEILKIIQ